jgi:2-polyprenyl-3-methyl-5-hydroxy-6-metoxy-1,4-benzoquinol methylase
MKASTLLESCPICASPHIFPSFRVAFPDWGPNGRAAWPIDVEPPVPHWIIARCGTCGVGFPNPLPAQEIIDSFYADQHEPNAWEVEHYIEATAEESAYWSTFVRRLTGLVGKPGSLLEIGPAAGHLLHAARAQGWTVLGVEATPKFARVARRRGIPIHQGVLATLDLPQESFDLIVMVDVLEHLYNPIADFTRCRALLRDDGRLVVVTCDIASFAARYYGLSWRQIVPSHTFYWTRRSLAIALNQAGLRLINIAGFRWWDPDPSQQRRRRVQEFLKLVVRKSLQASWMPLARHYAMLGRAQLALSRGRLSVARLERKVGVQAVMSDVLLAVARRR